MHVNAYAHGGQVSDGADNIGTCQPPAMGAGN